MVGHCFAAGSQTCDSESAIYVGGSGEVPPSLFQSFDYTALGHLHGPQRVGEYGRYCGSPLKYSFDEEHHKKIAYTAGYYKTKQYHNFTSYLNLA